MRTIEEIRKRLGRYDGFFCHADLLRYLSFEEAKPLLADDATADDWPDPIPLREDQLREELRTYLPFAWEKALDHRDLSANRSIEHLSNWLWLLEDDEGYEFVNSEENYRPYGAPILAYVCERYGIPVPDEERARRMARGERCEPDCSGCYG